MYDPLDYEGMNTYMGTRSPTGTNENDLNTRYFFRCLYQRALSIVDFDIPEGWNYNYFKNVLFGNGFIGVVKTDQYGIVPQICTLGGYGLYLQPTWLDVAQPLLQFKGTIGKDCEIIKLTPDYRGICDIVEHYANQLAICFTSVKVSLFNSRLSYLALGKNKTAVEALKIIAEKITAGEGFVFADKILKGEDLSREEPIFTQALDPARNYITDKLLSDMQTILNAFDREIGIPVIDDKKERRIETEVNTLLSDTGSRLEVWKRCLKETVDNVNRLFPELNITFTTILDKEGGEEDVTYSETDIDRALQL